MHPTTADPSPVTRPTREHIDIFGLSHPGNVRAENQDHFLIASLHKVMQVHRTSLPDDHLGPLMSDSRGYVFLVADGLGGLPGGQQASGTALRAIADYVTNAMDLHTSIEPEHEQRILDHLRKSVERGHETVLEEGAGDDDRRGMATTLTMVAVQWPRAYLVHVGDSRCYRLRRGKLEQMTRDQTMAQAMVEAGALRPDQAEASRLKHVLWSALGGTKSEPDVIREDVDWDDVMLICTDGLTKHVSNDEIQEQLTTGASAEAMCQGLVELALAGGGSDNVTVVVGRYKPR